MTGMEKTTRVIISAHDPSHPHATAGSLVSLDKKVKYAKQQGSTQKYLRVLKYWLPLQMFQEKLRLQGTRMTLPAHMYTMLHGFSVKKCPQLQCRGTLEKH